MRRSDNATRLFRRSHDRILSERGEWFVQTREGLRGPFATRSAAEYEAESYAETMAFLKQHESAVGEDLSLLDVEIIDMDAHGPRWRP